MQADSLLLELPGKPIYIYIKPGNSTSGSLHPDLALRVAAWQREGAPPGPARGGTTVIQGGLCLSSWWVEMWGPQGPWKPRKPDLTPLVAPWWPLQCSPASSGDGAVELWSGPTQDQVPGRALQGPLHTLELVPTGPSVPGPVLPRGSCLAYSPPYSDLCSNISGQRSRQAWEEYHSWVSWAANPRKD